MPRLPHRLAPVAAASLSIALAIAASACGGDDPDATPTSAPQTATVSRTATRAPTRVPTLTPSPVPATDTVTPEPAATDTPPPAEPGAVAPAPTSPPPPPPAPPPASGAIVLPQGGTVVVRIDGQGANGATALFRGGEFPMLRDGASFWVPLGAGSAATLGESIVTVNLLDPAGALVGTVDLLVAVTYTEYPTEYITLPPGQIEGISAEEVQRENNIRAATFSRFTPEKLWNGPFIYPSAGPISAGFGDGRSYNGAPVSSRHSGTDFSADEGAPVIAAATGRVAWAGFLATRGNSVMIDHGGGVFTGYHHMSRIDVVEGQDIVQGGQVGAVGATGLATGPHLHWELIVGRANVDPVFWTYAGVAP